MTMITGLTITDFLSLNFYKFGILQLMKRMKISDEDACSRNSKLFNSPSLIPPVYCHYFDTLLKPSQELTLPWKPVALLNFNPKFSILIYHSCSFSPMCLEIIPSYSLIGSNRKYRKYYTL